MSTFKKYSFMAGLPRSGGTLLCSILNQNSNIFASMSPVAEIIQEINCSPSISEYAGWGFSIDNSLSLLSGSIKEFYGNQKQNIIVDRNRKWGVPSNYSILEYIFRGQQKIIHPIRPLDEIVTSFIIKAQENEGENYIDKSMIKEEFPPYWIKNINDARVDWLLADKGIIQDSMLSLHYSSNMNRKKCFYINYNEIIFNTETIIKNLYDFLEIDYYSDHDYKNIPYSIIHEDKNIYGIQDLHEVRPEIKKISVDPQTILSDYALSRCQMEDFWTNNDFFMN